MVLAQQSLLWIPLLCNWMSAQENVFVVLNYLKKQFCCLLWKKKSHLLVENSNKC